MVRATVNRLARRLRVKLEKIIIRLENKIKELENEKVN